MSRFTRTLTAIASVTLVGLFIVPLWRIQLVAPQYPEGLGMQIGISDVRGAMPNDLNNINGLNHYIGMKRITPSAIPELRFMPWIVGGLMLLGLGAATAIRDTAASIGAVLGLLYLPPIAAQIVQDPTWRRHLEQIAPMTAGLAIQATTNLRSQPIAPWAGLGVLAVWAAALSSPPDSCCGCTTRDPHQPEPRKKLQPRGN